MTNFKVITCLACGNRQLFEIVGDYVSEQGKFKRHLERGCACGQNEPVVAGFSYYANAKKFLEVPLRKEFVLIHRALQSKLKVIELMKQMVDSLSACVAKAEMMDDTKPLKEVAKWLKRMVMNDVNQLKQEVENDEGLPHIPLPEL